MFGPITSQLPGRERAERVYREISITRMIPNPLSAGRMLNIRDYPMRGTEECLLSIGLGLLRRCPTMGLSPDEWLAAPTVRRQLSKHALLS